MGPELSPEVIQQLTDVIRATVESAVDARLGQTDPLCVPNRMGTFGSAWGNHGNPLLTFPPHLSTPARPTSDWSVMIIYPRVLRPIGPS
eukprot:78589-Pyramimonas_sp.AAC.1